MSMIDIVIQGLGYSVQLFVLIRKIFNEILYWKKGFHFFVIVFFTLFLPQVFILYLVMPLIIQIISNSTWYQNELKWGIALSSYAMGSVLPFIWAIYMLPFIVKYSQDK